MERKKRTFHLTDEKFTLRDFRGVLILITALVSVQLVIYFVRVFPEKPDKGLSVRIEKNEARAGRPRTGWPDSGKVERKEVPLKDFDPNTVDSATLVSFGFSPKQVASILKYRAAGGRFYQPEDFSKLYVVNEYMYRRLQPYIKVRGRKTERPKWPVDINQADSAQLDLLPGIGGFYARKIVEYRTRLGWFVDPEQLLEIYRFGEERYERLKDKVVVKDQEKRYLSECDSAFIVSHPYLGRNAYKAIMEYNVFAEGRKVGIREYLENKVIISLNGEYLMKQFR